MLLPLRWIKMIYNWNMQNTNTLRYLDIHFIGRHFATTIDNFFPLKIHTKICLRIHILWTHMRLGASACGRPCADWLQIWTLPRNFCYLCSLLSQVISFLVMWIIQWVLLHFFHQVSASFSKPMNLCTVHLYRIRWRHSCTRIVVIYHSRQM